ncbi:sensor histidine kinase [Sediminibacterium salmoneum]|uniref:sensor histidine kinase n=1 Tax=Sediminibacterium salmoneum TaxID=426421 RepID=UPI00047D808B|nr:ATP-binding protein [Sediminibacterium salmoneum]
MLHLLNSISKANSVLLSEGNINKAINDVIAVLGTATQVDRVYVFTNKKVGNELRLYYTHEWCRVGIEPQFGNPELSDLSYDFFPHMYETLAQDKFMYGLVEESTNQIFREIMESQGILTYLFTPIFCDGDYWGWIGYDNCTTKDKWEPEVVQSLYTVARNIGIRLSREKAETAQNKLLERFELTIKASQQGMWEWDISNNKLNYSETFMKMIGYEPFEFDHTYENWKTRVHPEDIEQVERSLSDYFTNNVQTYQNEHRLKHKAGHYVWINGFGIAKRDETGKPIYMVGTHVDVTTLKKQQEILQEQKNEFDKLINNLGEAVFRLNSYNQITFMNQYWDEISGYSINDCMMQPITLFFEESEIPLILEQIDELKRTESGKSTIEAKLKHKKKGWRWVELSLRENKAASVKDYFIAGSIIDIHDKKIALEKEKELAELKAGFVSLTSHQFRTPLTVIFSNIEVIEMAARKLNIDLSDRIKDSAGMIKDQIERMTQLMDNILLVGRYDAQQLAYNLHPINITQFIRSIIKTYFQNETDGRNIILNEPDLEHRVAADELLFMHVITNIISNAFKYSKGSRNPELTISYEDNMAVMNVKDFGIGIPADEIEKVFHSFYRASNTVTYQGSGLGLSVAKQFMELHNGKISLTSQLGQGTEVRLTLPLIQ